jgi:hypothetical protein
MLSIDTTMSLLGVELLVLEMLTTARALPGNLMV